jgi:protein TonB
MSVVMHGAFVGGALFATATVGPARPVPVEVRPIEYIHAPDPLDRRASQPRRSGPTCDICLPIPDHTRFVLPPVDVPPTLPPIGEGTPVDDRIDFGRPDPIGGGGVLGREPGSLATSGEAYRAESVDRVAFLLSDVRPHYPDALRTAGVGGRVLVRFVVDTAGRVESESVRVLEASHAGFESAVRDVLPRLRFRPAEVDARKVRMLVEMPFEFTLTDR